MSAQFPPVQSSEKLLFDIAAVLDSSPAGPLALSQSSPSPQSPAPARFLVCREAFLAITGTTPYLLSRAISLYHQKKKVVPHYGNSRPRESEVDNVVKGWLLEFRDSECERFGQDRWQLPAKLTWEDVYAQFQVVHSEDFTSYEHFCHLRANDDKLKHIDSHKRSDLPHCDVCTQTRLLLDEDISELEREQLLQFQKAHCERYAKERVYMNATNDHARARPWDINKAFVDYTPPLGLPHFAFNPTVSACPRCR